MMNIFLKRYIVAFIGLVCGVAIGFAAPETLVCHYGIADITPKEHVILAGFAARNGLSTTIHRRLKTHCLVIKNANSSICIITNDLMEVSKEYTDSVRREISKKGRIPFDHIFMNCIHTHSAPRTSGWCSAPGQPNFDYHREVFETIIKNAVSTLKAPERSFKSFRMAIARGKCMMNGNRCEKNGPCDRDIYALKLMDLHDKPIVALVNYSCHPVSLNYKSLVVSTDFPGIACEELAKAWKCPVFYFTGASGNIDPAGGLRADTVYTRTKGLMVADAIENVPFERIPMSNELKIANKEIRLPYQIDTITADAINAHVKTLLEMKGVSKSWPDDVKYWQKNTLRKIADHRVKNYLPFDIGAANIGGVLFFFTQGEPFCEYQMNLRKRFPGKNILFIAYENGQNSYLPSKYAYASNLSGYDYEKKEMHVYIDAPYPLSDKMPAFYEAAIYKIVKSVE